MKDRICFVIQRYGLEVNGGAELQCRLFAEHLTDKYEVEILTTKAINHMSWENEYKAEEETINGIKVKRFDVSYTRKKEELEQLSEKFLTKGLTEEEEITWIEKQGPVSPDLIQFIRENTDYYKVFIFSTYLYYPTVKGMPLVSEKAIFIPEAHDEPWIRMKLFKKLFNIPQAFFYNTETEREFVQSMFNNTNIKSDIGGIGIDKPKNTDGESFKEKYGIDEYIVYVGRIEQAKNCHILFHYINEYRKRNSRDLKLVLIGKPVMNIPEDDGIISLGFLDEQDKINGIVGAEMLVVPSEFESLSMVVLEAMCVGTPVLVNGNCKVLKDHCIKSNGAFYYRNYFEFEGAVNYIIEHPNETKIMCSNAKEYVDKNYVWDVIVDKLTNLIESKFENKE